MITQLIEGQEWLKSNIGVLPTAAWSVDPFGFGSVMPYILKNSQIDSMVILVKFIQNCNIKFIIP